ncbi:DNA translocase FtsK [Paenibacillus athensensis]|uniref:FtsK domain-containing protein n=1 Tax=Paenibacillus athensensis TaxID=1967502 RepID=A0A4Y8PZS7_9BACL|nr:FtsK/SpoIIIE domain-containing protein [Paenibacillus athensensis]MCD1261382.1 DNA translocase FtsK [Paenibacillus athensensis]
MKNKQELLIELLINRLSETKVGILVKGINDISPDAISGAVAKTLNKKLFITAVGYENTQEIETNDLIVATRIEKAVMWRSESDKAGAIITFVRTDSDKLHSLAEFDLVSPRDLSKYLLESCMRQETNTPTMNFWKALLETSSYYSYETLYEFVEAVSAEPDLNAAIPSNMWILGLLCDFDILSTSIKPAERLQRNRELIVAIGQMSEESRKKLSRSLVKATKDDKDNLQAAYKHLQNFYKYGRKDTLRLLSFEIVQRLFAATKSEKKSIDNPEGDHPKEESNSIINGRELESLITNSIITPTEEELDDLKELLGDIKKHFDDKPDDSKSAYTSIGGIFEDRKIVFEAYNPALRKLVGRACNETNWGGILETSEIVLRDVVAAEIENFIPFVPDSIDMKTSFDNSSLFSFMSRFDDQFSEKKLDSAEFFMPIIKNLIESRKVLLDNIDLIMYYPVLSFGVDLTLQEALKKYVEAWASLLRAYCNNELSMHEISQKGSNFVARALLLLDVLYIKTPVEWKGMLMPLHPLYLWRYYEVFKELTNNREQMSEEDAKNLTAVFSSLPQIVNFLVVDKLITNSISTELPCSGSIEMLPTFENKTNRYLGYDGTQSVEEILSRWVAFAPYTRSEVRICTVDAPDLPSILKSLKYFIDNNGCERIVYFAYLTRNQNGNSELAKLDYSSKDYEIGDLIKSGRISISIKNVASSNDVKQELQKKPVHLAFYFDQAAYSIEYGPSTKSLYINPLVVTYDYEFDDITHRGDIFPSSDMDSGLIGDYHKVMRHAEIVTANRNPRPTYNPDADISSVVSTIENGETQWLIAADRTTNNYLPRNTIPIGEKQYGRRMVSIWASKDSRIIGQYLSLLRQYNLYPDKEVLINILSQFGHISSEGLISIPRSGADAQAIANRKKGLIGTVFAAAWYTKKYQNSLVASLDTPDARLWLNDSSIGNERADLIGLRFDESTNSLYVQPIEVKTRDDSPDARLSVDEHTGIKLVTGHAADQIASVVGMLKEIFNLVETDTLNMFVAARREVLKYQVVSECFRHIHESKWQKQWSQVLKKAFGTGKTGNINIYVSGMLLHIKLSESNGGRTVHAVHPEFDDCPIEFVELTAKEIQVDIFGGPSSVTRSAKEIDFDETTEDTTEPEIEIDNDGVKEYETTGDNQQSLETEPIEYNQSPDNVIEVNEAAASKEYESNITKTESNALKAPVDEISREEIEQLARDFTRSCSDYHINLKECDPSKAVVGPSIIRLYFKLSRGQSLQSVENHLEDIGREMKRTGILIQVIHNSDEIILDIPRLHREQVLYSEVVSKLPVTASPEKLYFPIGRTPDGRDIIKDLGEMPHILIGGSTGSGKTVFLFTMLASLIKTHPTEKELQLVLSSSGLEDFVHFEGIPHLVGGKIISDAQEATEVIKNVVFTEFERREKILADARVANIIQYNQKFDEKLAPMVVVIDEFADLSDQLEKKKDKEAFFTPVKRIAQIGRKRGIHLVLCTQRPAANLVPSNIKSQLNGRLALRVNDANSSRMILEEAGAQHLQKHGDLIYKNSSEIERAQGYYISIEELDEIVSQVVSKTKI